MYISRSGSTSVQVFVIYWFPETDFWLITGFSQGSNPAPVQCSSDQPSTVQFSLFHYFTWNTKVEPSTASHVESSLCAERVRWYCFNVHIQNRIHLSICVILIAFCLCSLTYCISRLCAIIYVSNFYCLAIYSQSVFTICWVSVRACWCCSRWGEVHSLFPSIIMSSLFFPFFFSIIYAHCIHFHTDTNDSSGKFSIQCVPFH